jgi:RNA-binding motif X-linked protein 2
LKQFAIEATIFVMNVVKEIHRINERELRYGITGTSSASWHDQYKDSPWIFVGNIPYALTEGDLIVIFSQ